MCGRTGSLQKLKAAPSKALADEKEEKTRSYGTEDTWQMPPKPGAHSSRLRSGDEQASRTCRCDELRTHGASEMLLPNMQNLHLSSRERRTSPGCGAVDRVTGV